MGSIFDKLTAYRSLGFGNLLRVVSYKLGTRLGVHPAQQAAAILGQGSPWHEPNNTSDNGASGPCMPLLFSKHPLVLPKIDAESIPNWHCNPFTGVTPAVFKRPWWLIPDFASEVGDIKAVWELSRMDWAPTLAVAAIQGSSRAAKRLNLWFEDWCRHNPPYIGPNWKCGQESAIRLINTALASFFLQQWLDCTENLQLFIQAHLRRISPAVSYAIAQDNNHGTSEAVGLFIGGSWLLRLGNKQGSKWQIQGKKLLENRVDRLIGEHGTFSQYSTNYHRLMLDTLSLAEFWRRLFDQPPFSKRFYEQAEKATYWLFRMVDPVSGDVPNTGANDGARFFHFLNSDYRDFRPSVQLASMLFTRSLAYTNCDTANQLLQHLKLEVPRQPLSIDATHDALDGGFAVLRRESARLLFRYPRFRFRPSHCDALHVDFSLRGKNVLRDAGTYSYNTDTSVYENLRGTSGHNTVQFDGRDQMPKIGRFLYGSWLKTTDKTPLKQSVDALCIAAGYCDYRGAKHHRLVNLKNFSLQIVDNVQGTFQSAVLRWRLLPTQWTLMQQEKSTVSLQTEGDMKLRLKISSSSPIDSVSIISGHESRYYLELTECPILELHFSSPCQLETTMEWE